MNAPLKTFPRWMGVILVALLCALLILGVWFSRSEDRAVKRAAETRLRAIGRLKADQIAAWRAERLADASVLVESPFFAQGVARFLADARDSYARWFTLRFRSLQLHYHYDHVLLVDPQGRVLLHLVGQASLPDACRTALATALRERKPVLSELYAGAKDSGPNIATIAPIFADNAADASSLGAVILVSDANHFLFPLIQSWPTPSKTAETELIRRDGEAALFLNELRHQPDTALKLRVPLNRTDTPSVMAVTGRQGMFRGRDYRGFEVLAVILP